MLSEKGYNLYATPGTSLFFKMNGISTTVLYWPDDNNKPNTLDYLKERKIDLVINIPKDLTSSELSNDYTIRRSAVDFNIPLITNDKLASAFLIGICNNKIEDIKIKSWDEYHPDSHHI